LYAAPEFSCSHLPATLSSSEGRFESLHGVVAHDSSLQKIEIAPAGANTMHLCITIDLLADERVEVYDERQYAVTASSGYTMLKDPHCRPCKFGTPGLQQWNFQIGSPVTVMIHSNSSRSPLSHTPRYQQPRFSLVYTANVSQANDSMALQDSLRVPQLQVGRETDRRGKASIASSILRQQNQEEDNLASNLLLTISIPAEQGLASNPACGPQDPFLRSLAFEKQHIPSEGKSESAVFGFEEDGEWEGFTLAEIGNAAQFLRTGRCPLVWALWDSTCGSTDKCMEYCAALSSCHYFSFSETAFTCYLFDKCPTTDYQLSYSSYTLPRFDEARGSTVATCTAKMLVKQTRVRIDIFGCSNEGPRASRQEGTMEGTIVKVNTCPSGSSTASPPCSLSDPMTRHTYYTYYPFQVIFDSSNSDRAVRTRYSAVITFNTAQVSKLVASTEYDYDMSIYMPSSSQDEAALQGPLFPFITQPSFAQVFNFRRAIRPSAIPPRLQTTQQIYEMEQMRAFITCNRSLTTSLDTIRQAASGCQNLIELLFPPGGTLRSRWDSSADETKRAVCGHTCLEIFRSQITTAADGCAQAWRACPSHCFNISSGFQERTYVLQPIARALISHLIRLADAIFAIDTGCSVNEEGRKCSLAGLSNLLSVQEGSAMSPNFTHTNVSERSCHQIDPVISTHGCCLQMQAAGEEAWWALLQHPLVDVLLVDLDYEPAYVLRRPDLSCSVPDAPILSACFASHPNNCHNPNWPDTCCNLTTCNTPGSSGQLPHGACNCECADGHLGVSCNDKEPHVLAKVFLQSLHRHEYLGRRRRAFAKSIAKSLGIAVELFEADSVTESSTTSQRRMIDAHAKPHAQTGVYASRQSQAGMITKFRIRGESERNAFRLYQSLLTGFSNGQIPAKITDAFGKEVNARILEAHIFDARGKKMCVENDVLFACKDDSALLSALNPLTEQRDTVCYRCIIMYVLVALGVLGAVYGLIALRRTRYSDSFKQFAAGIASKCARAVLDTIPRCLNAPQASHTSEDDAVHSASKRSATKRRLIVERERERLRSEVEAGLISYADPAWEHRRFKPSINFSPVSFVRASAAIEDKQLASRAAALSGAWTRDWRWRRLSFSAQGEDSALPNVYGLKQDEYVDAIRGRSWELEHRSEGIVRKGVLPEERAWERLPLEQRDDVGLALDEDIYTCEDVCIDYDITGSFLGEDSRKCLLGRVCVLTIPES